MSKDRSNIELQQDLANEMERIELHFGHMIAKAALFGLIALPMIPGLLTMISVGVNFPLLLHIPAWVAWLFGFFAMLGIEVLGLFSIRLALKMRKYNMRVKAYDALDPAPISQGYTVAVLYIATVMTLTVLLKIYPGLAVWGLIPLALMGGLADWVFALNSDHNERESLLRQMILDEQKEEERQAQVDALTEQLEAAIAASEGLQETVNDMKSKAVYMQAQVDTLTEQLETANAVNLDLKTVNADLQEVVTDLQTEVAKLQSEVDNHDRQPAVKIVKAEAGEGDDEQPPINTDDPEGTIKAFAHWQIEKNGKVNKAEIARITEFSRPTVAKYVNGLAS